MANIGIIAIGRNEGERLRRCLQSVVGRGMPVVYVDSQSTDGSVELARSLGAEVVKLDASLPFSAARARNAGVELLSAIAPQVRLVQFVDGDCEIRDGWIERAVAELAARPDVAVVCGRRRERFPDASIYNRLAHIEWNTSVGETRSCGGDAMIRIEAFLAAGGFDATVVAGEEPELCQRLRSKGWKILRIDAEMTWHDAAMMRFGQWWKRQVRSGYGASDVAARFRQGRDGLFVRQIRSAELWTVGWIQMVLLAGLAGLVVARLAAAKHAALIAGICAAAVLLLWLVQSIRLAIRNFHQTQSVMTALAYGFLTMIGKWGFMIGRRRYYKDRRAGKLTRQMDYKSTGSVATTA